MGGGFVLDGRLRASAVDQTAKTAEHLSGSFAFLPAEFSLADQLLLKYLHFGKTGTFSLHKLNVLLGLGQRSGMFVPPKAPSLRAVNFIDIDI